MNLPKKGIYRHFKGKRYELVDFAKHSETMETMVVYRALYGEGGLWVRPLEMWSETVERNGKSYTRFLPEEEYLALQEVGESFSELVLPDEGTSFAVDDDATYAENPAVDKHSVLKSVYGYESFREGQEEVVDSILSGRDTLAILPTGAGKSLCYQLPAQMLSGITLVVSPLISLMKDQVNALTQAGVPAAYLNSSLSERQFDAAIRRMIQGQYRIVYVAPERLLTQRFLNAVRNLHISMVAVDEAHCISQWGQEFRPSYLEIPEFIAALPERPRLCAFTATATQRVKDDIIRLLKMQNPYIRITGFNRSNLYLSVSYTHEKDKKLLELMHLYRGFSGIIYCATRKNVEAVCEKLLKSGYMATRYHAGLSEEERQHNQEEFIYDRIPVMVATNAFGMGIDKSNVRFVIHYNMPKDIESYYQEAGRAGRDGERSDCHLLYEPKDVVLQNFFIEKMGEDSDIDHSALKAVQKNARFRLSAMADYCRTTQCLRKSILRYFGEEAKESCHYCSNCLQPRERFDVSGAGRLFVNLVKEVNGRYGARMIIDILQGADTARIRTMHLNESRYYGALNGYTQINLQYIADALIEDNYLELEPGEYPLLKCGMNSDSLLNDKTAVLAFQEDSNENTGKIKKENILPEDIDADLFEELRKERMALSKRRSVPPYAICQDAVLIDMCRRKPISKEEMQLVKGMGERKIQAFGSAFTKVIRKYIESK